MTNHRRQLVYAVALASPCLAAVGCQASRIDLVRSGTVALERTPDKRGYYRDVFVDEVDGGIVVTGFVRRFLQPGHVEVEVLGADGAKLAEAEAQVHRPFASSRVRHARFEVRVDVPPEDVFSVSVKHDLNGA